MRAHADSVRKSTEVALGEMTGRQPRKWLALLLRLLFASLLLIALLSYDVIDVHALVGALSKPSVSITCLLILLVAFLLGGIRWFVILRGFNIKLGFRNVFEIYSIGAFFNTFLPGGTGGDAVRVIYAVRSVSDGKIACGMSIVADRISGLYGMMLLSVTLILANADTVFGHPGSRIVAASLLIFFAAINIVVILGLVGSRPLMTWLRMKLETRSERLYCLVRRSAKFLELIYSSRASLAASLIISVVVSFFLIVSSVILADGQGWRGLDVIDYACASVFALLASSIPITPGGIGIAEGAFDYICTSWSVSDAPEAYGTIFLTYRLLSMTVSLLGAIALVARQRH